MSEVDQLPAFAEACSKGHQLFGKVKYCPFCGVAVVQPDAPTTQTDTAPSQPVVTMEPPRNEITAPIAQPAIHQDIKELTAEPVKTVQTPLPEPAVIPTPDLEQAAQLETEQQPQMQPPQPQRSDSQKLDPIASAPSSPKSSTAKAKPFPMWMVVAGGLIVALIWLFDGNKSTIPEQAATDAARPTADLSNPSSEPRKKPLSREKQPSSASEPLVPLPELIPLPQKSTSTPKPQPEPTANNNEKIRALLVKAKQSLDKKEFGRVYGYVERIQELDPNNQEAKWLQQRAQSGERAAKASINME